MGVATGEPLLEANDSKNVVECWEFFVRIGGGPQTHGVRGGETRTGCATTAEGVAVKLQENAGMLRVLMERRLRSARGAEQQSRGSCLARSFTPVVLNPKQSASNSINSHRPFHPRELAGAERA